MKINFLLIVKSNVRDKISEIKSTTGFFAQKTLPQNKTVQLTKCKLYGFLLCSTDLQKIY